MLHWRAKITFFAVLALTALAAIGGAFHWGADAFRAF